MKNRYSVYEAKTHLSEILRQVRGRHEVVITDRGKAVARVVPVVETTNFEERLEALGRAGILQPAAGPPSDIKSLGRFPGALKEFLETRNRF